MELNKEIQAISKEIQKECHDFHDLIKKRDKSIPFEAASNVFIYNKLAEFEYRLRKLEEGKKRADGFLSLHTPLK
jgi:hypothetical protein